MKALIKKTTTDNGSENIDNNFELMEAQTKTEINRRINRQPNR